MEARKRLDLTPRRDRRATTLMVVAVAIVIAACVVIMPPAWVACGLLLLALGVGALAAAFWDEWEDRRRAPEPHTLCKADRAKRRCCADCHRNGRCGCSGRHRHRMPS